MNRPGPVAAVGIAQRTIPVGISNSQGELSYFATSARDGRSSWLELPGFSPEHAGLADGVAVSPDGRWLGWVRSVADEATEEWPSHDWPSDDWGLDTWGLDDHAMEDPSVIGWAVKDTVTGEVRTLDVEGHDRVRLTEASLAFSGDSQFLLTSFETLDKPKHGNRGHQFVAWNVNDGIPTVLEEPGFYWLPSLGHASRGVVWSRKDHVMRAEPGTRRRSTVTLPRTVVMASWAPDDAAFAYIGRDERTKGSPPPDERLYVGATPSTAHRVVDLPTTSPIGEALAWRDATHVVVGNYRGGMYVVDVTDGSYETIQMKNEGEQLNTPRLATDLWAAPLKPPVSPTGASDPRRPWRWAGGLLFLAFLGAGASLLRRADRATKGQAPRASFDSQDQP